MKRYYVTCIVVRANQEMTFRNDIIEYEEITAKNVMQFQEKIKSTIFRQERNPDFTGSKILNVVVSAFSVLAG
jgi:hypothetical protein